MQLIYRGQTFTATPPQVSSYQKPCAINWRYQVQGEKYHQPCLPAMTYQQPKAINWRWQILF